MLLELQRLVKGSQTRHEHSNQQQSASRNHQE
jgi:hypothetical protein